MANTTNLIILPPPNMPLITSDNKIERSWYLCLRAIVQQLGGFTAPPLLPDDLAALTDNLADITTTDTAAVPAQLQSERVATFDYDLNEAPSRQDMADALLLAQNALDDASGYNFGSANPTAKVGLTPVNGLLNTFMRSDAAPPLDVTINVTWTGTHTFAPTAAATAVTINGKASQYAMVITAGATGGQCLHLIGSTVGNDTITIDTTATTGSATASFAATNKPGAASGAPGKWLPILADGAQYYIPLFN